jgi:hypothetical protein
MTFLRSSIRSARPSRTRSGPILAPIGAILLAVFLVGSAQAHVLKDFGPYSVALGWVHEPTFVGALNAIQAVVKDSKGNAVTDIPDGDLTVVVSVAGQQTAALPLDNAFDSDTGLGTPGDYETPIVPTLPGDYTFHLSGAIHGTKVDETATSSDSTFDSVVDSSSVDFPTKLPSIADIATALGRINARLSPAPGSSPTASAGVDPAVAAAAQAAADAKTVATDAKDSATRAANTAQNARDAAQSAMTVGIVVGGLGVVLAILALFVARRRPTDT